MPSAKVDSAKATVNAPAYWNNRFEVDWEERGGREQTAFFAKLAIQRFPGWLRQEIQAKRSSIFDFGCALGDAVPLFKDAFPGSEVSGGDIALSAITKARFSYPEFRFEVLSAADQLSPSDILFCSNTLEHFANWRDELLRLAGAAGRHVVILVPFQERERIEEHVVTFEYQSLPYACGECRLSYVETFDTSRLPDSRWPGKQLFAIYSHVSLDRAPAPWFETTAGGIRLDLRGLSEAAVGAVLEMTDEVDVLGQECGAQIRSLQDQIEPLRAQTGSLQDVIGSLQTQLRKETEREHQLELLSTEATERMVLVANRVAEHNSRLDLRRLELQQELQAWRDRQQALLNSRTWRWGAAPKRIMRRIRGRDYSPSLPPAVGEISLPKLDIPWLMTPKPRSAEPVINLSVSPSTDDRASDTPMRPATTRTGLPVLVTVESLHRGGLERVVVDIATGLSQSGCDVRVAVARAGGDCADELIREGFDVKEFAFDAESFASFVQAHKPAFALANHCYFGLDVLSAAGVPIIEIVHNYYVWNQTSIDDYIERTATVQSFVAVSTGVAEYHARAFRISPDRISVVNNPINPRGLLRPEKPLLLRARRAGLPTFTFVNVAQFFPAKAHAMLLSAFEIISARHPEARLSLVGQQVDEEVTKAITGQIAAANLGDKVELSGYLDRRMLSHKLAGSHAFVQPSVYEGFSIAMAEAAHFALPIIATRVGGAIDLVRESDCGLLIPPFFEDFLEITPTEIPTAGVDPRPANLPALVDAMEEMLLKREEWEERGFVGQARIDGLTPKMVASRYIDLARRLM